MAWAMGLVASCWISACDGLLGDVQIETARLSAGGLPGASGDAGQSAFACLAQTRRCVDGRLERCNDELSGWVVVDQCATPELCELTRESGTPICEPPRCVADERRCNGATLRVCNVGLTGFDDELTCESAVLCDPASGCRARACELGERRCNGPQIETCNPDGDGFIPIDAPACASATLCTSTGDGTVSCREPVCAVGDFRCAGGALLQRCAMGQDAWEDVRQCDALEVCDAQLGADGCRPAACQPDERRCGNEAVLECNAARDGFDIVASCGNAGCDPATIECLDPCLPGVRRCAGAAVEVCPDAVTGWQLAATCRSDTVCDVTAPTGCREAACAPNAGRCRGAMVERCNAERTGFEPVEACATEALCVPEAGDASCAPPACAAGERECRGRVLAICNADRTGFDEVTCGLLGCNGNADPPDCRGLL